LLVAVYFLPSFLVVAIGKGQLQNRHPKARQLGCVQSQWPCQNKVERNLAIDIICLK
jgi:hypothetical protein